ncbi:uncharacterized protein LOC132266005 [Phlebotomus argentipes]|uniref:uncharacterized protein LOC132266005 n=1 Tax=Phlebotomus argentipes TaxID=94469 RepID=UPI0028932C0B|nr:uncharacterized protein LOC132266005 [Phlebotomus argentipes]
MAGNNLGSNHFAMLAKSLKMREELRHRDKQDQLVQELNQQQDIFVHTLIGARELELLIAEFNPARCDEVSAADWIRDVEKLGSIHGWATDQLLLFASMRLSGVARMWYEYSLDNIANWEDFKRELLMNFPRTIDTTEMHGKLMAKKRGASETLEEYFHSTVKVAKRMKLTDDSIKDYLIRGLQNPKHEVILSSIGSCSLTGFLQHMVRLEEDSKRTTFQPGSSQPMSKNFPPAPQAGPSKFSTVPPVKQFGDSKEFSKSKSVALKKKTHCLFCKSDDHMVSKCPKMNKKPKITTASLPASLANPKKAFSEAELEYFAKMKEEKKNNWAVKIQLDDSSILKIRRILDDFDKDAPEYKTVHKNYQLVNGKVYYRDKEGLRFVVPKQFRSLTLSYHDCTGHAGYIATLKHLQRLFWYPQMSGMVTKYINSCIWCRHNSRGRAKAKGAVSNGKDQSKRLMTIPFYHVFLHFFGPYAKTTAGHEFVCAIIDVRTKFRILKEVCEPTGEIAVKILNLLAEYFPTPTVIITQSPFVADNFKAYCTDNGITQRLNADLNVMMTETLKDIDDALKAKGDGQPWDQRLPQIRDKMNSTPTATNFLAPTRAIFHYMPYDIFMEKMNSAMAMDRPELISIADESEDSDQAEDAEAEPKAEANEAAFQRGDVVLLLKQTVKEESAEKPRPRYQGPYVVKKVLKDNKYIVCETNSMRRQAKKFVKECSADELKKWPHYDVFKEFYNTVV